MKIVKCNWYADFEVTFVEFYGEEIHDNDKSVMELIILCEPELVVFSTIVRCLKKKNKSWEYYFFGNMP